MFRRYENTRTFAVTSAVLGVGFLFGALAHVFGWLPLGTAADDSRLFVSGGMELLCGFLLLGAAVALRRVRANGWRNALGANGLALVGLVLTMLVVSPALGAGVLSMGFHAVMLLLLVLNTIGLWRLRPRNPLKRAQHEMAARLY
jgi:peptidoglycan/LPS O-acetylase OafA/YrhL